MSDTKQVVYQYQRLVIQYKDLEAKMQQKEQQWKDMQERFAQVEMHTRELCEEILAKDKSETGLGKNYSWSSVDIIELIKKAKSSFQHYNSERSKLLKQLLEQSETRRKTIEKMKAEPYQQALSENPKINETIKAVKEVVDDGLDAETKHQVDAIVSFFDDVVEDDSPTVSGAKKIAHKVVRSGEDEANRHNNSSDESVPNFDEIDTVTAQLSHDQKLIIRVMGETGNIMMSDIHEAYQKYGQKTKTTITGEIKRLNSFQLIHITRITEGLRPNTNIYYLTALGECVYFRLYGKKAIRSQYQTILGEHSSLEHGLNIMDLANCLRKYGQAYEFVKEWNRKDPISVQVPIFNTITKKVEPTDLKYVPDIRFRFRGEKQEHYIEYERNTCSQEDFFTKCEKMLKVTRILRFVTPNADETNKLIQRVKEWIRTRKQPLPVCQILVTSCVAFRKYDMSSNEHWEYEYDSKKKEWIRHSAAQAKSGKGGSRSA